AALAGPLAAQKIALPGQNREPPAGVQTGSSLTERQPGGASEAPFGKIAGQAPGENTGDGSGRSAPSPDRPEAAPSTGSGVTGEQNLAGKEPGTTPSAPTGQGGQDGQVSAGTPPQNARESGCPVEVAVVGMSGELLFGPGRVTVTAKNRGGITPLGALDATGLPYTTSARWANFVESVAGQGNKGQAGWMYSVNGEVPLAAADQKKLKTADKIIWWYSRKINEPAPAWEELANKK
ncbi:MAG: DUF4430 domain-containing protein, partial [Desulfotomaculales bacterium]